MLKDLLQDFHKERQSSAVENTAQILESVQYRLWLLLMPKKDCWREKKKIIIINKKKKITLSPVTLIPEKNRILNIALFMQSHRISSIQSKPCCETGGSLGYCHCMPAPGATSLAQRVSSAHHGAHSGQGTRTYFKVSPWFYPHLFPAFQLVQKKKINLFIKFEFQVLFLFSL